MEGVQHAVADEPVRARGVELRIGAVAIERAVELAWQFADDFEIWARRIPSVSAPDWSGPPWSLLPSSIGRSLDIIFTS